MSTTPEPRFSDDELRKMKEDAYQADMEGLLDDMESALGWVVVTTETDVNRVRVFGLFDQPAAAMECAAAVDRYRADLPADEDDWSVAVLPLLPP